MGCELLELTGFNIGLSFVSASKRHSISPKPVVYNERQRRTSHRDWSSKMNSYQSA